MENQSKKRKVANASIAEKSQAFIMCGSYEKVLLGWNLNSDNTLVQTFLTVAHQGCIKAIAASQHLLATSSTDETVKLYNLGKKKELGAIQSDSGVVSCLQFYSTSHLFAGSENGNIYVWDTKTWDLLSSLQGHKGAVLSISVHPSGKMMLSLSKDGTFKLWDIIKGECAFTSKTERDAEKILWSSEGTEYIIVSGSKVDVFRAKDSSKLSTLQLSKKLLAAALINKTYMAVGGEDQEITIFDITNGTIKCTYKAHNNRIKAIDLLNRKDEPLLVTISSDGYVKLWNLGDQSFKEAPELVTEVSTSARLTCVSTSLVIPSKAELEDKESDNEEVEEIEKEEEEEKPHKEVIPKQQKPKQKKKKVAFRGKS